jgi:hypothetical protein
VGLGLAGAFRPAAAQVFDWAQLAQNKGSNGSIGQGGSTDLNGNTYIGFGFVDSARVGGQLFMGQGSLLGSGLHLVKYDSTGRVAWVKVALRVRVPLGSRNGLKADPVNGGFFVMGDFSRGATWGGVPIPAAANLPTGTGQGFYGKCDASGALLWTRPLPFNINATPNLTVDGLGNCYVAGAIDTQTPFNGVGTVGGAPIDSTEMYLLGNTPAGTGEWVRRLRATPFATTNGSYVTRYPSGLGGLILGQRADSGVLLIGTFNQTLLFNGATVLTSRQPAGTTDSFIATISPTGALSWIRPSGGGGTPAAPVPSPGAAAADLAGNYYVTGGSPVGPNPIGYQNTVIGVAKYSSSGALLWVTNQATQVTSSPSIFYNYNSGTQLVVDHQGEVTILAQADIRPLLSVPVIGNFELRDYESLIHFTAAGVPQWVTTSRNAGDLHPQITYAYNDFVSMDPDAAGNLYYVTAPGSVSPGAPNNSGLMPPTFLLGELTQVGAGISVARIGTRHNTVRGRLYLDANGNGVRDGSEGAFPDNFALEATQATRASLGTFDTQGFFNVYVGAGAYSLAAPVPPLHYALTQPTTGPYTGSFVGYGLVDTARHFGFRPVANQTDVRVTLTPYGAARPGFITRYRVTVQNVGTTTVASGTATATLDSRMAYISSTPNGSRTGQTVTWTYANLAPFARREFDVLFSLPINTPLGTQLSSTASAPLAADVVPADNSTTATQAVTGSFDPNDITVNYQRLTPAQVAAQLPLDYTIRFQNMGTDTAFTVVITDTLDFRKLNVASLMLVAQSHDCIWSLSGTSRLTVRFLNINLPHRNQDVIRSQGFVRFRILPKTTLAVGEIIPNHAGIVFDYNAPVITNTATTTVFQATAALARHDAPAWTAYPNPATEAISIAADLATAGPVTIELLDVLGHPLRRQTLTAPAGPLRQLVDLHGLAAGVYLLRLTPPTGPATSRRVVRE